MIARLPTRYERDLAASQRRANWIALALFVAALAAAAVAVAGCDYAKARLPASTPLRIVPGGYEMGPVRVERIRRERRAA